MNEPLWLAIRLPQLALDCHIRGYSDRTGLIAVTDTLKGRETVIACNAAARAAGVQPGMAAPAAGAVAPGLHCLARDPQAETEARERIAAWCYQYSDQVCLLHSASGDHSGGRPGLVLEAGASERLFGKPAELASRLELELGRIGYHAAGGSAPTPEAAWLAAHDGQHVDCRGDIRRRLGPLPIDRLHLEAETLRSMAAMGLRQLRDLLRLPHKSLGRRFGPALTVYLDRLLGIQPDPRRLYQPAESYAARLELPAEISQAQALLFPLRRMVEELCGVLRGGDNAVQEIHVTLGHERGNDSLIRLGLQSPSQDPTRLMSVLRERLERLRLPENVREIRIEAESLFRFAPGQSRLFHDAAEERQESLAQLAERLQARLGRGAVSGIGGVEDHRPEYSWRLRAPGEPGQYTSLPHRPSWLLPRPRRCDISSYEIVSGPERIESGWWDGRDCRRDYFVVRDRNGCRLWAFHEYKPRRGWFVHGIFS